jgi:glycosyltransferase involved in cell wall biosynthesis
MIEQRPPVAVSVVIPAFNEEVNIAKCLQALVEQTLGPESFEVIVVDNGSIDATVAVAAGFRMSLPLQIVSKTGCRISAVRNHGAALATGTVLAFLDADCIPRPTWLESLLELQPRNSIWGAPYLVPTDATWVGTIWFKYQATAQQGRVSFLPGGNLCIARSDFEKIGGFDESVSTSEDVELCARARKLGLEVIAYPSLAVFHEGTPRTLHGFYRQNRWHGEHVLRMFLASPSMRVFPVVALSVYTLLMFWAALVFPIFALLHRRWLLALLPIVLLLLPAALLSLRKTAATRCRRDAPALFLLYLTYLIARAASLARLSSRTHR